MTISHTDRVVVLSSSNSVCMGDWKYEVKHSNTMSSLSMLSFQTFVDLAPIVIVHINRTLIHVLAFVLGHYHQNPSDPS